ncbi:MAG: type IV pilus assembly protein PilM [Candidatus Omnitrophota bacterium]|jgi:type IV pilus assembly protein PilM
MAKTLVGIDIGNCSVKITELIKKGKVVTLNACGLKTFPAGVSSDEQIKALKELHKELGITEKEVNISVCGKDIISRYVIFPPLSRDALIRSLKFEFEKYIPFPLNDCVVDIDIFDKRPDGRLNVLIVSAKKYFIQERLNLLKQGGFIPKFINIDSLSLYKTFTESPYFVKNSSFILLNLGYLITNMLIVNQKTPVFSRDIHIAGQNFTHAISERMDMSQDKAENLKCSPQVNSLLETTLAPDLNALVDEITLSIEYARKNYDLKEIKCVYISGGSSKLNGLDKFFENKLKIRVESWNPFVTIKKIKNFEILETSYPDLTLSLGIAMSQ